MPVNINGTTGVSAVQSGVTLSNPIFTSANTANGVFSGTSSFTGNVAVSGANSYININGNNVSPYVGMKNRFINGDFRIDQRYAGVANTVPASSTSYYVVDRFFHGCVAGTGTFTVQQMNGANTSASNYESGSVPSSGGFINSVKMTVGTANTSLPSTGYAGIYQAIEGLNTADLSWGTAAAKTITISFWTKSSITGQFSAAIWNPSASQTYPMSFTISQANTWQYVTLVVPGSTTGTWPTNNSTGLNFAIFPSLGSSYLTSSTGWTSNLYGITGQTNWMATSGNTFYFTGFQLEVGTQATPFEARSYTSELSLCQRYFQKSYDVGTVPGTATRLGIHGIGGLYGGGSCINGLTFRTSMRAAPTVTIYDGAGTTGVLSLYSAGSWTDNSGQVRAVNTSENGFNCNYGYVSNPWTTGQPGNCHWKADAEI